MSLKNSNDTIGNRNRDLPVATPTRERVPFLIQQEAGSAPEPVLLLLRREKYLSVLRIEPQFLSHLACSLVTTPNTLFQLPSSSKLHVGIKFAPYKTGTLILMINLLTLFTEIFFLHYRSFTKKIQYPYTLRII